MKPCEGVDDKVWAPCKPGYLRVGECVGVELGTGEVRALSPGSRGGDGEG